jgi:hypothetical protein
MNLPSRPCIGPPHLRQVSCWSGKTSSVSTRTSLYHVPQFGHSNGVAPVDGIVLAEFDIENVLRECTSPTRVKMPALGVNQRGVQNGQFLNGVVEELVRAGVGVLA